MKIIPIGMLLCALNAFSIIEYQNFTSLSDAKEEALFINAAEQGNLDQIKRMVSLRPQILGESVAERALQKAIMAHKPGVVKWLLLNYHFPRSTVYDMFHIYRRKFYLHYRNDAVENILHEYMSHHTTIR